MAIFTRRTPSPIRKRYRSYKRFLRIDFEHKCVFCGIHENDHGGFWHFHVEHFKPKSIPRFMALKTDYTNLMYSCDHCNIYKGNLWPSDDPIKDQKGWIDPCIHDFDSHYKLEMMGTTLTLTTSSKLGVWISSQLLLDNSLRLQPLEKIARRNQLDAEIIIELEKDIQELKKQFLISPSNDLRDRIVGKESILLRLKNEKTEQYKPVKFK